MLALVAQVTLASVAGLDGPGISTVYGQTEVGSAQSDQQSNEGIELEPFPFENLDEVNEADFADPQQQQQPESIQHSVLENRPVEDPAKQPDIDGEYGLEELSQWLTRVALSHMPHEYEKEKNWGEQEKRWAGFKFRRDGERGRLETKRRYKMVNHGTWRKYGTKLANPEEKFSIEVSGFGTTDDHKTKFSVSFLADLLLNARQSKWVKGVQLYSLSASGSATVRLTVHCEVKIDSDFSEFPPALVLKPEIADAELVVDQFEIDRVSKAGGEVAQQVTRMARKELDRKIHEHEQKLVKKLNKEIDENRDKLRLSIADTVKLKWFNEAKEFIPSDVKKAISVGQTTKSNDSPDKR